MGKTSLLKAFTLRKRLRSIITTISDNLSDAPVYIHVSSTYPDGQVVEHNKKPFEYKGRNIEETYSLLLEAEKNMVILNNLIDEANVKEARKYINELEMTKANVSMLESFAKEKKRFAETVSTYDSSFYDEAKEKRGGIITNRYTLVSDFDWAEEARNCKKKIVKLEDKLSEINATTVVEIPDGVLVFIENNI